MRKKIKGAFPKHWDKIIAYDWDGTEHEINNVEIAIQERKDYTSFKKFFFGEKFYKKRKYNEEYVINLKKCSNEFQVLVYLMQKIDRFNRTLLTIQEFAEDLGITRQTMSNILKRMEESNLILLKPPKMIIVNPFIFNSGGISAMNNAKEYWCESWIKKQGRTKSIRKSLD